MSVRRVLGGVILGGLAAPLLAAAPLPAPPPGVTGTRVFARADAEPIPSAVPSPAAEEPAPPRPASASPPSPEVAARARAELEANRTGKIDRTHYTADMAARITDASLAEVSTSLKALGAVKSFTQVRKITQGALTLYVFRVEFEKPPIVEEAIAWNAAGKVDFLQFRTTQQQ
ncbi:MAG TPA: hypothetical protein VK669_12190 [Candidatus Limnocylindrales bacterium]|nr:hypothetical protein [Candidatus Limnocylindrales bacterium]